MFVQNIFTQFSMERLNTFYSVIFQCIGLKMFQNTHEIYVTTFFNHFLLHTCTFSEIRNAKAVEYVLIIHLIKDTMCTDDEHTHEHVVLISCPDIVALKINISRTEYGRKY